jgi:hypothetical protein
MKAGAILFIVIIGILLLQPGFQNFRLSASVPVCMKKKTEKSSCSKTRCGKESDTQDEKKDCGPDRCNPFMGCATGNFYVHNYWTILIEGIFIPKHKLTVTNDNRISGALNECWHPPEII